MPEALSGAETGQSRDALAKRQMPALDLMGRGQSAARDFPRRATETDGTALRAERWLPRVRAHGSLAGTAEKSWCPSGYALYLYGNRVPPAVRPSGATGFSRRESLRRLLQLPLARPGPAHGFDSARAQRPARHRRSASTCRPYTTPPVRD